MTNAQEENTEKILEMSSSKENATKDKKNWNAEEARKQRNWGKKYTPSIG